MIRSTSLSDYATRQQKNLPKTWYSCSGLALWTIHTLQVSPCVLFPPIKWIMSSYSSAEDLQHSLPVVSRNAGRKRSTSAEPPNLHVSYNQALRRKATSSALPACRASPLPTATTLLLPLKAASEPSGTRRGVARQLSGAHRRRGPPLLERRPITAFTYPPIATAAPTQASGTPCSGTWDFFSFCYECGRSSGVHLSKCPMCKSVCYCSLSCKENSWKTDHRDSCTGWRGPWVGTRRSTAEDKSRSGMYMHNKSIRSFTCVYYILRLRKQITFSQNHQDNTKGCLATKFP